MAAFDIFLKLDGINGESTTKGHEKEIEVVSYDQSIDSSVPSGGGGGGGAGKATFSGVRFRKLLDTASIPIALACASGLHIANARFAFRRASNSPLDFYIIALEDVVVTHAGECASADVQAPLRFETLAKSPSGAALLEEVTLHFGKIRWEYRQQGPKGQTLPPITGGWDVKGNTKLDHGTGATDEEPAVSFMPCTCSAHSCSRQLVQSHRPPSPTITAAQPLDRRLNVPGRRVFVGGERTVQRTLVLRSAVVAALFLIVIAVFWFDRDGLRDHADGSVSFADVVYFTMVSVTTVGYGDIVPVTRQARLVDAVLVTPIRLFIWLIFIGTAYQLVLQRLIEDFRMRRLQARLQNHVVLVGYGHSGRCAAAELVARGFEKGRILIIDLDHVRLEHAAEEGYVGILGDASREETLREAMLSSAHALLICTDRDDTNVLITLTARHLSPDIRIVARVEEAENDKLLRQSGASSTVLPSRVGGILMADSVESAHLASYVMDLISADGEVVLTEREPGPEEIGRAPAGLGHLLIVRVIRGSQTFSFWEPPAEIQAGDKLIVIQPRARQPESRV